MNCIVRMRCSVLLLLAGGGVLVAGGLALAQSPALPATPPTAAAVPAAAKTMQPAAHRAQVVYSGGLLTITADDSSLNQILRDVSRQTGMKITGGVADQRVFGKVGPGAPAEILTGLLDGTGSNMLLRENPAHTPVELVLTPRGGGATPPGPFASGAGDDAPASAESPSQAAAPPSPQGQGPPQPSAPQTSGFGGGPVAVPAAGPGAAPSSAPPPSRVPGNPQSPNGVLTPQQIFQQLQQLQQLQQQQQQQPKSK